MDQKIALMIHPMRRLDVSTMSCSFVVVVVVSVVIKDSINDPPHKQWLARLDINVGSLLSLFIGQPSHPLVKTHHTSSGL